MYTIDYTLKRCMTRKNHSTARQTDNNKNFMLSAMKTTFSPNHSDRSMYGWYRAPDWTGYTHEHFHDCIFTWVNCRRQRTVFLDQRIINNTLKNVIKAFVYMHVMKNFMRAKIRVSCRPFHLERRTLGTVGC